MRTDRPLRQTASRRPMAGLVATAAAFTLLCGARSQGDPVPEPLSRWPTGTVTVTGKHAPRSFRAWLAATDARREQGLMFVRSLEQDQGMWFQFDVPDMLNFWMKNTFIPLDIVYVAGDGRIVRIADRAAPFSLTPIPSGVPAVAVLELGGGVAKRLGIRAGDHATFRPTGR